MFYIKSVMLTDKRPKEHYIKVPWHHTFNQVVKNVAKDQNLPADATGALHRDKKIIIRNEFTSQECYIEICEGHPPGKTQLDFKMADRRRKLDV